MQIDRVFFPTKTLGYGNRVSIWTIGCPHRCCHCSNPELWEADVSRDIPIDRLLEYVSPYLARADGITITGGEPFLQAEELLKLLVTVKELIHGDVLVFSGFIYEDLLKDKVSAKCLELIDILIDGKYDENLHTNIGLRGSLNQRIIVLNPAFTERYKDAETYSRQSQIITSDGHIMSIGIPIRKSTGSE